jgi:predicted pyridoxine 5'-phosphate oxidase superfamily flavin-nucleotide-binding protein
MARITNEMREITEKARVPVVATATVDGKPNAVPITFTKVISDDEILIMDNFMQKTRQNIDENPQVAISVWDMESNKAFQFKGYARIESTGKTFDEGVRWVRSKSPRLNPKAAVIVKVDEIYIQVPGPDAGKRVS